MELCRIVHLTPSLPPNVGGVNDYAAILGEAMQKTSGGVVQNRYVCAGRLDRAPPAHQYKAIDLQGERNAAKLVAALETQTSHGTALLLNYVGYAYDGHGAPVWLVKAVRQFRKANPDVVVVTMFHELYATAKPWQRAFWLSPLQRHVAAGLAVLSDAVVTNRPSSKRWLEPLTAQTVKYLPIFSMVGEPEQVPSWSEREPIAIVFGSNAKKKRVYDELQNGLATTLRSAGLQRLVDIGPVDVAPPSLSGITLERLGILPAAEVGDWLQRARVGLLPDPANCLTKSSVFGAFSAHGLATIVLGNGEGEDARLRRGFLRWSLETDGLSSTQIESCGINAKHWYQTHAHSTLAARVFFELIGS